MVEIPSQQLPNQPTPPGVNWKNILVGAVIGTVLVGTGVLAFYLYQGGTEETTPSAKNDEISNWKTYRNEKYKFSIKYPPGWSRKEEGSIIFFFPPGETIEANSIYNSINISRRHKDTPINPDLIEYETIRKVLVNNEIVEISAAKNVTTTEAYLATIRQGDYYFTFKFGISLDRKYDSLYDHTLSTFKSTD